MLTVACVRTGTAYPLHYVERLRNMVARHLPVPHRFICLTDQPTVLSGVERVEIAGLAGWWGKMALFDPAIRGAGPCIYFDLDTVIVGDLTPLAEYRGPFAICRNFMRDYGNMTYRCDYGSCAMAFPDGWGADVYGEFMAQKDAMMKQCGIYGDQYAIQLLRPGATALQDVLPPGFFSHYRTHTDTPNGASVLVFGGKNRPHNSPHKWIAEAWR